jgi:beta-mannosidase
MDGTTRPLRDAAGTAGTDAAVVLAEIPTAALRPGEVLAYRWQASNGMTGGDIVPLVRHKALDLLDPKLSVATTAEGPILKARISAEALAFFVTVEADRPGSFSTNAVAVFPGHDAEVDFIPADGDPAAVSLITRDLHSSFAIP